MSFAQELLWLLDRATPGLTAYNVPRAFRLRGPLDASALRLAIEHVVARHEILRTTYSTDGSGPVQVIHEPSPFDLQVIDFTHVAEGDRAIAAERFFLEQARRHFDIANELQLRGHLLRFGAEDHVLVLVTHHIASDGWSKGVMFRELTSAYAAISAGNIPALPALQVQYGDFAQWQRTEVEGGSLSDHLEFWHERLAEPLPTLELPTDFSRPAAPGFEGGREMIIIPREELARLREAGLEYGATLYMVLLAAYHTVLHHYSGQNDILTGSPTASRNLPQVEGLIGYFANTLAMRTNFDGDPTLGELLERVSENAIGAYEHEDVPFEKLVLELRDKQQAPSHAPLFTCVLTMEDTLSDELALGAAQVETLAIDFGMAKFDLTLLVAEQAEGLRLALWYRSDLFSAAYARRFLTHMHTVLQQIVTDPSQRVSSVSLLTEAERRELARWNNTDVDEGPASTVVALFEQQAARVPSRIAVIDAHGSVSYESLNLRANQLARHLGSLDVKVGTPVGLLLDRSSAAIAGLLGILKAGCAYVPLSVDAPAPRIAQQLSEGGISIVVSDTSHADRIPASATLVDLERENSALATLSGENLPLSLPAASAAYVLYTSGSTGVPKGVVVSHANIVHYARAVSRVLGSTPESQNGDGFAALDGWHFGLASTLAADLGNTSLYPALLSGGTLHALSSTVTTEPARYAEYVSANPLDLLKVTPNHFQALTAGKTGAVLKDLLPRQWLVFGGEALRPDVARTYVNAGVCRVLNHYGPTETTVGVCTFEVSETSLARAKDNGAQTVPVGRPLANTRAFVVNQNGQEQPVGIPGELWLGGAGVTSGYLNRPDLTAERFVQFGAERCYRTGDRVRRHTDGTIEFLGRTDDQVKVRGYRVELREIEHALRAHPGVSNGTVLLHRDSDIDASLVAYAVARPDGYAVSHSDRANPDTIVAWLGAHLPEYMVPQHVIMLDTLPLTPNGKVDKARLPKLESTGGEARFVAPRSPTEEAVAKIWSDVLKRDRVGVTDRFLDLGGHSLLAIRVLGRISKELGVRLALRSLFETPTIEQLAGIVDKERAAKESEKQREAEEEMRAALAAVESLSDDEVQQLLGTEGPGNAR